MKITFLGTGSIIPSPKRDHSAYRSCSSIYVELNNGETFLFDIGPGTLTKAQQIGIDTRIAPDNLFISHYHIDHCQDFIGMVKGRSFNPITGKLHPGRKLTVFGPQDLEKWSTSLFTNVTRWSYMKHDLHHTEVVTLNELKPYDKVITDHWTVSCAPVDHYDGIAFRLDAEGKSFVYSGDMGYDEHISELGKQADLVAIECSFPDIQSRLGKHLCPEDVGKLASMGEFKHTVLTHLYPQCEGKEEHMKQVVQSLTHTEVSVAEDFWSITL